MTQAFDAAVVAETAEWIRSTYPRAAQLIDELWAEVQRLSDKEYVPQTTPTREDYEGPFLPEPVADVEFFDASNADCGYGKAEFELKINKRGFLLRTKQPVDFVARDNVALSGYRVFIGSDLVETTLEPKEMLAGDQYPMTFHCPIRIGRQIDHRDRCPPPDPPPTPEPDGQKREKIGD